MMSALENHSPFWCRRRCNRFGYTLVEVLVVLFLLVFLAAIALPNVKELLADQKVERAARNLTSFIDNVRSRAIAENRQFGILIERGTSPTNVDDPFGRSQSIRIRQLTGVPPYSGDASNSFARLEPFPGNPNLAIASFDVKDNQLLKLSADLIALGNGNEEKAPIRDGDYIELPGGRLVPFRFHLNSDPVQIRFDLTLLYPEGARDLSHKPWVRYRIHRRPVVSNVAPFTFPRGIVLDLNFSGIGRQGNQFASFSFDENIEIIFGMDGSVSSVTSGSKWNANLDAAAWDETPVPPLGQIFLCLGESDGIVPNDLLSQDRNAEANVLNQDSRWIVIHSSTGRAVAAPFAPVDLQQILTDAGLNPGVKISDPNQDPTTAEAQALRTVISTSRYLANLSDTVDAE